jgi:hypothetical protein
MPKLCSGNLPNALRNDSAKKTRRVVPLPRFAAVRARAGWVANHRFQNKFRSKGLFMRNCFGILISCLLCSFGPYTSEVRATLEVGASVQIHAKADFFEPLASHGSWVEMHSYGRCWRPRGIAAGWRPYCDGDWVWTDFGWYWNSNEPWAWACYHYGRWVYDLDYGWVWVPDVEWAPAWVYWRVGGGYIGWAPCPPPGVIVAPASFAFVKVGHFEERVRPSTLIVNNTAIVNKTTKITKIERGTRTIEGSRRQVVINEGPGVDAVQKATGKKVSVVPIQEAARRTPFPSALTRRHGGPATKEGRTSIQDPLDKARVVPPAGRPNPPGADQAKPALPAKRKGNSHEQNKGHGNDRDKR